MYCWCRRKKELIENPSPMPSEFSTLSENSLKSDDNLKDFSLDSNETILESESIMKTESMIENKLDLNSLQKHVIFISVYKFGIKIDFKGPLQQDLRDLLVDAVEKFLNNFKIKYADIIFVASFDEDYEDGVLDCVKKCKCDNGDYYTSVDFPPLLLQLLDGNVITLPIDDDIRLDFIFKLPK